MLSLLLARKMVNLSYTDHLIAGASECARARGK